MTNFENLTVVASEYPLSVDIAFEAKKLYLDDWEAKDELILELPLTDDQIKAIQECQSLGTANIPDRERDLIIIDCKKGFVLARSRTQLTLGKFINEDWYTVLLTLPITTDQLQIIRDACERAEIYRLTHDEEGNLIIPPVSQDAQLLALS